MWAIQTVHQAGVSVRGKVGADERNVPDDQLQDHRQLAAGGRAAARRSGGVSDNAPRGHIPVGSTAATAAIGRVG